MRRTAASLLIGSLVALTGCGGDDGEAASTGTPVTTTSTAPTSTTGSTTSVPETTTSAPPPACPDDGPVPAGATDAEVAPVAFDGDGDGVDDALTVFRFDGATWLQVTWAAGGSSVVAVDDADLGARPLGGHDLDGDGADEAWVAIAGPASGSLIGVFRVVGCGVRPVVDTGTGQPFSFPVTHSLGAFGGARCESNGTIALVQGQRVDDVNLRYEASETAYTYDPSTGAVTAGAADVTVVDSDETGALAGLACGMLVLDL